MKSVPNDIFVVTVPQLGVNDEFAEVVQWYVSDECKVTSGQKLCALETTKALYDVDAEVSGYVVHTAEIGTQVNISQPIALIGPTLKTLKEEKQRHSELTGKKNNIQKTTGSCVEATLKARATARQLGVDLSKISADGIIREQDVIRHYSEMSREDSERVPFEFSWNASQEPVMVYGAGKGAITVKECLDFQQAYKVVCFVDDNPLHSNTLCELPVYHSSNLSKIIEKGVHHSACAIADAALRLQIFKQFKPLRIELINVIHPKAYLSPTVKVGKGNYIKAGAIIETKTTIGNCCIIDNGAVIAHDNVIADGCHIAPGVAMGSGIQVGQKTIIGIGASIATGVTIGQSVIISVGSSVIRNVPDYSIIEGVPGKIIGQRKNPSRNKNTWQLKS